MISDLYEGCRNPAVSEKLTFNVGDHLNMPLNTSGAIQQRWSPYSWHGGSVVGIAGTDFAVIASDTRLGEHGAIYQRDHSRLHEITANTVMGNCGFHGDATQLIKIVKTKCKI